MEEELASLRAAGTWELAAPPPGVKVLPVRWVFKIKRDAQGNIERYKARLVVKGFMQQEGVDFNEVYAPVSKHSTLRALLATVAVAELELHQLDVKTAFLNGELDEDVWCQQPPGFGDGARLACHLQKALYGLRQAPRAWHKRLVKELESLGFVGCTSDPGLFILHHKAAPVWLLVYVDDLLLASRSLSKLSEVKMALKRAFDVHDLGDARFFLGMEIARDKAARTIKLSQAKMAGSVLARFGFDEAVPASVPMSTGVRLVKPADDEVLEPAGHQRYQEIVGSLLYLSSCTRPDISHAVGVLSKFMSCPAKAHMSAAKGVLRYLAGTRRLSIQFGPSKGLLGFCDADYAGDKVTWRSTSGYAFLLHGGPVSWSSKLQSTVAASTTEAEYMAAAHATKEALWLRQLLWDLGYPSPTVPMRIDNQAALTLIKEHTSSDRAKHVAVAHHICRERHARGEVHFTHCGTKQMVADCMTKPLPSAVFEQFRKELGMI
jgi:hypothetical protein